MRINSTDKIAGVPILDVRKLLRSVDNESEWGIEYVAKLLRLTIEKAHELLQELHKENYIQRGRENKGQQLWGKTFKGSTLGLASAAPSISRKTADRILSEFMARVHKVNSDFQFLYKVKKVILFGSYLSDTPKINDIDIAVEVSWKENHPDVSNKDLAKAALDHAKKANRKGRRFSTFLEELAWPQQEVLLYLKSRSRSISLHTTDDQILKKGIPQEVIWQE